MAERGRPGDADESQGEEDQGDGCHPCLLVGDASQDGIESQKIPLGHDVRWGGEWVGVDRVVWVAMDWRDDADEHRSGKAESWAPTNADDDDESGSERGRRRCPSWREALLRYEVGVEGVMHTGSRPRPKVWKATGDLGTHKRKRRHPSPRG